VGSLVAIDIGRQFLKIIHVAKEGNALTLKDYAIEEISDNGVRVSDEVITKLIRDTAEKMRVKTSDVRTTISGRSVVVRNVDFPNANKNEILRKVKQEENKYIPIDLNDYFYDIALLSSTVSSDTQSLKGIIAAAKKDSIMSHTKIINDSGLTTSMVEIPSLSLVNLYEAYIERKGIENKITACIDFGALSTQLGILIKNDSVFSREINIGSNAISKAICEALSCDFASAEKMKKTGSEDVKTYLAKTVHNLVEELMMSFNFFEGESGKNVQRLFFVGGGVLLEGVADMISSALEIPYEIIDPLSICALENNENSDEINKISPLFALCIGLAVRSNPKE